MKIYHIFFIIIIIVILFYLINNYFFIKEKYTNLEDLQDNKYIKKKLDYYYDINDALILNIDTSDAPKLDGVTLDETKKKEFLNYLKNKCDSNKDCYAFKFHWDEKPVNYAFYNNTIRNKNYNTLYTNNRDNNNSNIVYTKHENSTFKNTEDVLNGFVESLDDCKDTCNRNKYCYGVMTGLISNSNEYNMCTILKKSILDPGNIINMDEYYKFPLYINKKKQDELDDKEKEKKHPKKNRGHDIVGARPSNFGNSWNSSNVMNNDVLNNLIDNNCQVGFYCSTQDGFGTYNKDCECIVGDAQEEEENKEEEGEEEECNEIKNKAYHTNIDLKNCYPNNSNFAKICKKKNSNNGIKNIIPCNDNYSRVNCDPNYINGKYHGNVIKTPCLDKSDDFDVWCKYYNNKPIPEGYNVNSIGTKDILIGEKGECYLKNGSPDNSKASAICDYDYIDTSLKLEPANKFIDNNIFTDCLPIKSNFNFECSLISDKLPLADQIMGYDCNPGFARAKCINRNNRIIPNKNRFVKNILDGKTNDNNVIELNSQNRSKYC